MPFIALSLLVQVALVVHVVKTGRSTMWIWIVVMLPGAGSIAYVILEILPELMGSSTAGKASQSLEQIINPNKGIDTAAQNYSVTDTVENSLKLAEECMSKAMYEEAKGLYEKSLTGIHEDDPHIMFQLAKTEYFLGNCAESKHVLELLIEKNPEYKNQEAHLLFAKTVDALGEVAQALEEYQALAGYYLGAEAKYRYASLLRQQGQTEKANLLLAEIVNSSKLSSKHYRSLNKKWITSAKKELGS